MAGTGKGSLRRPLGGVVALTRHWLRRWAGGGEREGADEADEEGHSVPLAGRNGACHLDKQRMQKIPKIVL